MLTAHSAGPGVASLQALGLTSGNRSAAYSRGEAQPVSPHLGIACAGSHSAGRGSRKAAAALNQFCHAKTQPKKPLLWQSLPADRTALCSTAPAWGFLPKHVGFPAVTWPVPRKVSTGASASCREKGARGTGFPWERQGWVPNYRDASPFPSPINSATPGICSMSDDCSCRFA